MHHKNKHKSKQAKNVVEIRPHATRAKMLMHFLLFALLFAAILLSGCAKKPADNTGLTEVLRIDNCNMDNESLKICCEQQCNDFCVRHKMVMAKYFDNALQCACWCE